MITDNNLTLSGSNPFGVWTGQSLAVAAGTYLSTNVIDTASTGGGIAVQNQVPDWGAGKDLYVAFDIVTALAGSTSVKFQLVQADDAPISVNVNVLVSSDDIPISLLTLGAYLNLKWAGAAPSIPRRYLAARYVTVGTGTAGAVVCNLVYGVPNLKMLAPPFYRSAFGVQ